MITIDWTTSHDVLAREAEKNNPEAFLYIALHYAHGTNGFATDEAMKMEFYQRGAALADGGSPTAQYCQGVCCLMGYGMDKDENEAVHWYSKAAEQGHEKAQHALYSLKFDLCKQAAEQDNPYAQYHLGIAYYNGVGVEKDHAEALRWFREAADNGDKSAICALYELETKEDDPEWEFERCQTAAEAGSELAQYDLCGHYALGTGVAQDEHEATKRFGALAEQGYVPAQVMLGIHYSHGIGTDVDHREAAKWFRKAAEQGDAEAQYRLAMYYLDGVGVEQDTKEAIKWLALADDQGHEEARQIFHSLLTDINKHNAEQGDEVAMLFLRATETEGDDPASQFEYCRVCAEEGNPRAQFDLGFCYYEGHGVEKDKAKAVYWWQQAAGQGYAEALYDHGIRYRNGDGVEKNIGKAFQWIGAAAEQGHKEAKQAYDEMLVFFGRQMAEQGDALAQFRLGSHYSNGEGVEKDMKEAVHWWHKAAEQGNVRAMYNLYACYQTGDGVDKNEQMAFQWLQKAADGGHPMAQINLALNYCDSVAVNRDNRESFKLLREATKQGNEGAFKMLNMDVIGEPPLHVWIIDGDIGTLKKLIQQGANVNTKDKNGISLLYWASMMRCEKSCRLLLDAGADVHAYASETDKRTAFHQAIWDWHRGICEMLLEAGADIHALDADNETPLHWAAKHGPVEALEFLLKRGARTDLKDNQGKLPIDVADTEEKKSLLREAMG